MGALFLIPLINFMILIFLTRISPAPIHHIQESIAHDHYRANLGTAIAYESFHRNARRWPFIQVSPSRSGNNYEPTHLREERPGGCTGTLIRKLS